MKICFYLFNGIRIRPYSGQKRGRPEGNDMDTDEEMQESFKRSCFLPSSSSVVAGDATGVATATEDVNVAYACNQENNGQARLSNFPDQYGSMNQLLKQLHMERQQRQQLTQRPQTRPHYSFAAPANVSHQVPNHQSASTLYSESMPSSEDGAFLGSMDSQNDTENSAAMSSTISTHAQNSVPHENSNLSSSRKRNRDGEEVTMEPTLWSPVARKRYRRKQND